MHVYHPSGYTPRSMRRKGHDHGATKDLAKQQSFRRAAAWSKRFINLSASALANPKVMAQYAEWADASRRGVLRRSTGGAK